MYLILFASLSLLGGLMLTFGEVRRLFTHSFAAVLENLLDWKRGRTLKIAFGIGMMYFGAVAVDTWLGGHAIGFSFEFPYFTAAKPSENFNMWFAVGTCVWILAGFLTAATKGDVFPEWVTRTFYTTVKAVLYLAWAVTGVFLATNMGDDQTGDLIGGVFWLIGFLELRLGSAGGFGIHCTSTTPAGTTSESFGTWWSLNFKRRPVLYVMSVLITLAFAALCSLAGS